ncbi:hypothetical protein PT2222_20125 [Paraburkholderia tropica]
MSDAHGNVGLILRGARAREAFATRVVHDRSENQPDDPRDIGAAEAFGDRAGVQIGRDERQLHGDAEQVGEDRHAVEASVDAAVLAEERVDVIVAVADEVVVDQVHRRPGHQHVEQQQNEVGVFGEEVALTEQRDGQRDREQDHRRHGACARLARPRGKQRLHDRHRRERAAVQVHRVGRGNAHREHDHHQTADAVRERGEAVDHVAVGDHQADHRAQHHREDRAERAAPVARPERHACAGCARHVARVVGDIRRVRDLPECRDRNRAEKARGVRGVACEEVGGQAVHAHDPDEREQQHRARAPRHQARVGVDQVVAENGRHETERADHEHAVVHAHVRGEAVQRLTAQHEVRREEAQIHHHDEADHQQRAERAELAARLHHLRDAELRTLRRMQRHEHGAHQRADHDAEHAPPERLLEHGHGQRARDDGQQHDVRAEPDREQVARAAVTLGVGYGLDRALLEASDGIGLAHRRLLRKESA